MAAPGLLSFSSSKIQILSNRMDAPALDGKRPEAEWGFEPALCQNIEEFARDQGYYHVRIIFDHPEDPSPLIADFYRAWYQHRKLSANRLLIANMILMYWFGPILDRF